MLGRLEHYGPWLAIAGMVMLLAGLVWDLGVHRSAPEMAAHEGVLATGNLGHHLFAAGLTVLVSSLCLMAAARLSQQPEGALARLALAASLPLIVGLAGAALALGAAATHPEGNGGAASTAHPEGHVHSSSPTAPPHEQADAAESAHLAGVHHPHGKGVPITAQELLTAADLVQRVRDASRRYQDVRAAEAEGYRRTTNGLLLHYVNPAYYLDDRTLDVERIESLVYARGPGGTLELVGVMFMAPPGQPGPDFGGPLTGWHTHDNLCIDPRTWMVVALSDVAGRCPAGSTRVVTGEMLHVWLVDTPAGVFADGDQVTPYLLRRGYRIR